MVEIKKQYEDMEKKYREVLAASAQRPITEEVAAKNQERALQSQNGQQHYSQSQPVFDKINILT